MFNFMYKLYQVLHYNYDKIAFKVNALMVTIGLFGAVCHHSSLKMPFLGTYNGPIVI